MTGAVVLPIFAALLHPFLGWCVQRAYARGVGMVLVACLANFLSLAVFAAYLRPAGGWTLSGWDWLAVLNGGFFFLGQWFSLLSVRRGDLAVHSAVIGAKLFLVAALSVAVGLEQAGWSLVLAVVLAVVAIFLVAGASWSGLRRHRETVVLTLFAALFFALVDFCTGWRGQTVGTDRYLLLMMASNGALSLLLLLPRLGALRALAVGSKHGPARWHVLAAGLALGLQALLINLALSWHSQPALTNVAYGLRAVFALIWLWIFGRHFERAQPLRRFVGSVLMVLSLWLALRG